MKALSLKGKLELENFSLNIDLEIEKNETIALLGPNGSGKSTLLKLIAGIEKLNSGILKLEGKILDDSKNSLTPTLRRIGWVPQNQLIFDHLTVSQNIGFSPKSSKEKVSHLIDNFALSHLKNRKASDCSGGESQRVAIARAIASEPNLLLLDEPFTALDNESRQIVNRALETMDIPATLIVTHDLQEAVSLSKQLIILEEGEIKQVGTLSEIRIRPTTLYSASLTGLNFVKAYANGLTAKDESGNTFVLSESMNGPVNITISPKAIALHKKKPEGSPRNVWEARISGIHTVFEHVRITFSDNFNLVAEVTPNAVEVLDLKTGDEIWVSIKATELLCRSYG